MNKKLLTIPTLILAIGITSIGLSTKASADQLGVGANLSVGTNTSSTEMHGAPGMIMNHDMPQVWGVVTAVNGSTITVQSKTFTKGSTTSTATIYTINASSATVTKANAASTVSAIAVGDNIAAQGTLNGTSLMATRIIDGIMMKGAPGSNDGAKIPNTIPNGNGQPIIGGKVTAVSGNTVTITNSSNVAYTIDVTSAKITKNGAASTTSNIAVGDELLAQGTINGNSVAAVNVVDSASVTTTTNGKTETHKGFFGTIGNFFSKLFGF